MLFSPIALKLCLSALVLLGTAGVGRAAPSIIFPGSVGAPVRAEHAERVSGRHPERWIASVRASAYQRGHEPFKVVDGDARSDWRVAGPPPAPMSRGQWIEIELNEAAPIEWVDVHWLGDRAYEYKVAKKIRDDFREPVSEGRSAGNASGFERIQLPRGTFARVLRFEFSTAADNAVQGVREIRVGGLAFPAAYPPAADAHATVEPVRRILYVEFERLIHLTTFDPKLSYADGGAGLRLMPRADAFEGGHADFEIATTPGRDNWVTLKLWESHIEPMMKRGNLIVLETLDGGASQLGRTLLPELVSEQQRLEQEWYGGPKPQPGRWAWAHYRLPKDLVGKRSMMKLRAQGVGNVRRDRAMQAPAPAIYRIESSLAPQIDIGEKRD
ncbi:discoidin domain-containing protein [Roseateles sp.]|uniref:discoidin domain-containing protein n=1 Tax=Roseateles sp. TaxID=1971397 RepID=UPI0039E97CB1